MASISEALKYLLIDEGGYSNNPDDPGGETYEGISRVFNPNWEGWAMIDVAKQAGGFPGSLRDNSALSDAVTRFYQRTYWEFDGVVSQPVANKVFDLMVNMEPGRSGNAIKLLQTALRFVLGRLDILVDGHYGPETETAVNAADEQKLLTELRAQAAIYYCKKGNPNFQRGWMRRAVRL